MQKSGRNLMRKTLLEQCLDGELIYPEIAERIDLWKQENPTAEREDLQSFLGMTDAEFSAWEESPAAIRKILFARRQSIPDCPDTQSSSDCPDTRLCQDFEDEEYLFSNINTNDSIESLSA